MSARRATPRSSPATNFWARVTAATATVIDVRPVEEYVAAHIAGAQKLAHPGGGPAPPLAGADLVEYVDLDAICGTAFPALKDVVVWTMGPNDEVRLLNSKGAVILDFMEVESHMYEAERKGEGLFFMRTQAAIKAATVTPEQVFGEWILLREFEKPLCRLTLSNTSAGGESYKIAVKPGCDPSVADVELSTWQLDSEGLLLTGRGGSWRFSESDATTWERIPASADPLVLMRQ